MILEMAILDIRPGQSAAFEQAMATAQPLIAATPGFQSIELRPSIETRGRYLLLVTWDKLEDHTVGFRQSSRYQQWRALLHGFYDPFPVVEHYDEALLS